MYVACEKCNTVLLNWGLACLKSVDKTEGPPVRINSHLSVTNVAFKLYDIDWFQPKYMEETGHVLSYAATTPGHGTDNDDDDVFEQDAVVSCPKERRNIVLNIWKATDIINIFL